MRYSEKNELIELLTDVDCPAVAFTLNEIEYVLVPEQYDLFFVYIRHKDDDYKIAEINRREVLSKKVFNGKSINGLDSVITDVYST